MQQIKIFTPASVANVSCGFDILGFCLDGIGDEMIIRKTDIKGVKITQITGYELPYETEKNVAGVAALALLDKLKPDFGIEIEIYKKIKPGSGIGSSSASAAGAVYGINALLDYPLKTNELIQFAMQGETLASGVAHADNVAPVLLGGFTLVKSTKPLQVLSLPTPSELYTVILHPKIEIKTADSRAVLPSQFLLETSVKQAANLGSLVSALYTNDYNLLGDSLHDYMVEPYRKELIPYFDEVKKLTGQANTLGCGISGSGPSIFTLTKGKEQAEKTANLLTQFYQSTTIPFDIHLSKINTEGIRILESN